MTEGWICEGGHPLYLIDGEKFCPICILIAERGVKPQAPRGRRGCSHTVPMGVNSCYVCERHRKAPWLRALDQNGRATCPRGHEATHETLKYSRRGDAVVRRCARCEEVGVAQAQRAFLRRKEEIAAAEGRQVRHRDDPKKRLPADFADWVVILRLIEGKVDEVYDMKRGEMVGATAMEKWVAYHSTSEDYNFTRTQPSGVHTVRHHWTETGQANGWKPKTLAQFMSEL